MLSFASGLVIGLILGGTVGLVLAGLFAAAKNDEVQVEMDIELYKDKIGR